MSLKPTKCPVCPSKTITPMPNGEYLCSMGHFFTVPKKRMSGYKKFYVAFLDVSEGFNVKGFDTEQEAWDFIKDTPMNTSQIFEGRLVKTKQHYEY